MKKLVLSIITAVTISISAFSQAPESFKYQAIARDVNGAELVNQNVAFKISLLQGSSTGSVVYTETHNVITNSFGLINLEIGTGSQSVGLFSTVDWANNSFYVKIELDETGGTNYQTMGTSQLLSVPYALYAKSAGGGGGGQTYTAGSGITIAGSVISNNNPDQTVSLTGTGATTVTGTYPNFTINSTDNINDADASSTNEIQALSVSGNNLSLSNGGGTVALPSSLWSLAGSDIYRNTGNVGIGTASPVYKLDISNTMTNSTNNRTLNLTTTGFTNASTNSFSIRSSLTGQGSLTNHGIYSAVDGAAATTGSNIAGNFASTATAGENCFGVQAVSFGGGSIRNYGIYTECQGTNGTLNVGVGSFATQSSANTNFGILGYSENAGTGTSYSVYGEGTANTDYAGYFNGNLAYNGTLTNVSDRRLKENIKPFENSLDKINALKIYTYNYSAKGDYSTLNLSKGKQFGFIAQELEQIFPELVHENNVPNTKGVALGEDVEITDATYKSVNHIGMIPILTKAIQEQQELIERLEKRISELENKQNHPIIKG